jgi:multidrug resistance efflux pump
MRIRRTITRLRTRTFEGTRRLVSGVPMVLVWLGAVYAVLKLSHGQVVKANVFDGYAESQNSVVAPVEGGMLKELRVEVGAHVKKGDVIGMMDDSIARAQKAQLEAELKQLQARITAEEAIAETDVARSEIWVLNVEANELRDRAELKELDTQLARLDGLAAQKLVAAPKIEALRRQRQEVAARVDAYDAAIARGQAGLVDPSTKRGGANPAVGRKEHKAVVTARTGPFREQLGVQLAKIHEVDMQIERCMLRAPVDGAVDNVVKRPGEVVAAGSTVVELVAGRPGIVLVEVHEKLSRGLQPGARVVVERKEYGGRQYTGKVIALSPQIDQFPQRARLAPNLPVWGRHVVVQLDGNEPLLPGEAFRVWF